MPMGLSKKVATGEPYFESEESSNSSDSSESSQEELDSDLHDPF